MKYVRNFILAILIVFALPAEAATLSAIPSATNIQIGGRVTVRIWVDPAGVSINNAEAVLSFPSDILQVESLSKADSALTLWVEEPTFSNTAGTVFFNGGVPNPGITNGSNILSVTFSARKAGNASISLNSAAVRANDGEGTDVLTGASGTRIAVAAPAATTPAPAPATPSPTTPRISDSGTLPAVAITSATHPDQRAWYSSSNPTFLWKLPRGVDRVQLGASKDPLKPPAVVYTPPITERSLVGIADGIWYFSMRYQDGGVWSKIATYTVNVDTEPPIIAAHEVLYDTKRNELVFEVSGADMGSGIQTYEVLVDTEAPMTLSVEDMSDGSASVRFKGAGLHHYTLSAVDNAGNRSNVKGSVAIPESLSDQVLFSIGDTDIRLLPVLIWMAVISIASTLLAVLAWVQFVHYRNRREPNLPAVMKGMHKQFESYNKKLSHDLALLESAKKTRALTEEELVLYNQLLADFKTLGHEVGETFEKKP